ncbi:HAD-like domain-containing protein [Suillus paluster]|uniref:HAD-like domain-containing protein n=1 Tax=Suillus paluster TaxID=48578 RepID=UPI001B87D406|nr:HAD-like domain-containing protein [Suillus paluster]KAG1749011.1 HAD-like domain-containing protein [Suillus paluster]
MSSPHLKAIIFDIGGVVLHSPQEKGLPKDYLNVSIASRGPVGAWQKFERGELSLFPFYEEFGHDLSDTENGNKWYMEYCARKKIECPTLPVMIDIDGRELFGRMMRQSTAYDDHIWRAIRRIRATGKWLIIALTNNYSKHITDHPFSTPPNAGQPPIRVPDSELRFLGWEDRATFHLRALFDDFCDSSELGMRKPDPEFYLLACNRNGIRPGEAVFLDDIGMNLKAARGLGMETIHVPIGGTLNAVKQLAGKLGIDLTGDLDHNNSITSAKL